MQLLFVLGNSILKDGRSINENYGTDLDKLEEGDKVGVLKTAQVSFLSRYLFSSSI